MQSPVRAVIVEDVDPWVYVLRRAVRYAGISEVVTCKDLDSLADALQLTRFDVALVDIGLDPDDDVNSDGVKALEMIRAADGDHTRCVIVSGWQGGDRMSLQADADSRLRVDWAYMKEKYDATTVIAKLTDFVAQRPTQPSGITPMASLRGSVDGYKFEAWLLSTLSPRPKGIEILYSLTSRMLAEAMPLVPQLNGYPMRTRPDGSVAGMYWSRSLGEAVVVAILPAADAPTGDAADLAAYGRDLAAEFGAPEEPLLLARVRDKGLVGLLYELPGLRRGLFAATPTVLAVPDGPSAG